MCMYKKTNILKSFMSHKRKVEMILKENAEELQDNEKKKMLFGPRRL